MMIELDDDEARLLYAVVLDKAQEHFIYASTSEVADKLSKLAPDSLVPPATWRQ
jgi:hypothetical protein